MKKKSIRDLRRERRLSQIELADELSFHKATIQRWEYGTEPQEQNKKTIAEYFGLDVADICWTPSWRKLKDLEGGRG